MNVMFRGERNVIGDDGMSLFVAGATFGEYLGDSRNAKCCVSTIKIRPQSAASKLGERMGCGCPFHSRITLGTLSEQLSIGRNDSRISGFMLEVNISWRAQFFGDVEGWQLLLRIVLDVSCVRTMRECHVSWQAQFGDVGG